MVKRRRRRHAKGSDEAEIRVGAVEEVKGGVGAELETEAGEVKVVARRRKEARTLPRPKNIQTQMSVEVHTVRLTSTLGRFSLIHEGIVAT